ncbi:oxidoreductase, partial [Streptomyces sp. SID6139]|nr:oxidoreductase [Streptomyces sp. SID6139]
DAGTVAAHLVELRKHAPAAVSGYVAMARATADRALAHGLLKPELAEDLLGALADGTAAGAPGPDGPPGTPGIESDDNDGTDGPTGTEGNDR